MDNNRNNGSEPHHIVVIGTSAGGVGALEELVSQLHAKMNAAFFIVMHLSQRGVGDFLVQKLQKVTPLHCQLAEEGVPIQRGHIYVARPDKHLLLTQEGVKLGYGPKENRWKPSIDVLFRSAAASFDGRTTGVILTGFLNDGTAGMQAIKKSGGTCIVQDPNEAEYPDMPYSVLNTMQADYCVSLVQMGTVLEEVMQYEKEEVPIPAEVAAEAALAERMATSIENLEAMGERSLFSCPDCGGALFNLKQEAITRYRCYTGHSFTPEDLLHKQKHELESTLWVALRFLEERKTLLRTLEMQNLKKGFQRSAIDYRTKAVELEEHIQRLKQVIMTDQKEERQ